MFKIIISKKIAYILLLFVLSACAKTQTTSSGAIGVKRSQYMLSSVTSEQINQSYAKSYTQLVTTAKSERKLDSTSNNAKRLQNISQKLIAQTPIFRQDALNWDWETNLIISPELNANCGPGGKIIVYTGIIEKLNLTDDELAAIVGHEIAHALREHGREGVSRAYANQVGSQIAGAVLSAMVKTDVTQITDTAVQLGLSLPNSRENETEADLIGLELMARAGFDPNASITLWEKMQQNQDGSPPQFLSTHPSPSTRIKTLRNNIPKVEQFYLDAKEKKA